MSSRRMLKGSRHISCGQSQTIRTSIGKQEKSLRGSSLVRLRHHLSVLEQLQGLAGVEVQILLVGHQAVDVDNVLVEQHTRDLASDGTVDGLDAGVDSVTNHLLAAVDIRDGGNLSCVHLRRLDLRELRSRGLLGDHRRLLGTGLGHSRLLLLNVTGAGLGTLLLLAELARVLLLRTVALVMLGSLVSTTSGLSTTTTALVVVTSVLVHLVSLIATHLVSVGLVDEVLNLSQGSELTLGFQFLAGYPELNLKRLASENLRLIKLSDGLLGAVDIFVKDEVLVVSRGSEETLVVLTESDGDNGTALLELRSQLFLSDGLGHILDEKVGVEGPLHVLMNRGGEGILGQGIVTLGDVLVNQEVGAILEFLLVHSLMCRGRISWFFKTDITIVFGVVRDMSRRDLAELLKHAFQSLLISPVGKACHVKVGKFAGSFSCLSLVTLLVDQYFNIFSTEFSLSSFIDSLLGFISFVKLDIGKTAGSSIGVLLKLARSNFSNLGEEIVNLLLSDLGG